MPLTFHIKINKGSAEGLQTSYLPDIPRKFQPKVNSKSKSAGLLLSGHFYHRMTHKKQVQKTCPIPTWNGISTKTMMPEEDLKTVPIIYLEKNNHLIAFFYI